MTAAWLVWRVLIVVALVGCQAVSDDGQPDPPSVAYDGSADVVVVAGPNGAFVVESSPSSVRYELQVKDALGEPVSGAQVSYRENVRGRSEFIIWDAERRIAPLFWTGTPTEIASILGVEPMVGEVRTSSVVGTVLLVGGVIKFGAELVFKTSENEVAHQRIQAFVEEGEDLCEEPDVYCVCTTVSELSSLQRAATQTEHYWSEVGATVVMFAVGKGVGKVNEYVGVAFDATTTIATAISAAGHADLIIETAVTSTEYSRLELEEYVLVRLLAFDEGDPDRGRWRSPTWRAVQVLDRGCGPLGDESLRVGIDPFPGGTGGEVTFTVSVTDPIEDGLDVAFEILSDSRYPRFFRWEMGVTDESGRVEFTVPPHQLGRSIHSDSYRVSVPARNLVLEGSLPWEASRISDPPPRPTIWELRPDSHVVAEGEPLRFSYLLSQTAASDLFRSDLSCRFEPGDGVVLEDVPCVSLSGREPYPALTVRYTYSAPGRYTATLSVENRNGDVDRVSVPIWVMGGSGRSPEILAFEASPTSIRLGDSVRFTWRVRAPDADALVCVLGFGDGSESRVLDPCPAEGGSVSHRYRDYGESFGLFPVTLSVWDGRGASTWKVRFVMIGDDDSAVPPLAWTHPRNDLVGSRYLPASPSAVRTVIGERWRLELPTVTFDGILTGDVTGDGSLNVVTVQDGSLYVLDADGAVEIQESVLTGSGSTPHVYMLEDVSGDGVLDIGIGYNRRNSYGPFETRIYDGSGSLLRAFARSGSIDGFGMAPVTVVGRDVIMVESAGFALHPRGFSRWSVDSGDVVWSYGIAPNFHGYSVADVTGDGKLEFLYSTGTPHNGASAGGTNDANTYTIIVNEDGVNVLTQLYPFDSNTKDTLLEGFVRFAPGEPYRLVSFKTHQPPYRGTSRVHVRDLDGTIRHTSVGLADARWFFGWADLSGDGVQQLVASNWSSTAATLTVFDRELRVDATIDLGSGSAMPVVRALADLTGDGHPEVLVSRGAMLTVYDRQLDVVWQWSDGSSEIRNAIVSDLDGDGRVDVIVLTTAGVVALD